MRDRLPFPGPTCDYCPPATSPSSASARATPALLNAHVPESSSTVTYPALKSVGRRSSASCITASDHPASSNAEAPGAHQSIISIHEHHPTTFDTERLSPAAIVVAATRDPAALPAREGNLPSLARLRTFCFVVSPFSAEPNLAHHSRQRSLAASPCFRPSSCSPSLLNASPSVGWHPRVSH
jgi:hypothetical protein